MTEGNASENRLVAILTSQYPSVEELFEVAQYPLDDILPFLTYQDAKVRTRVAEALRYKRDATAIEPLSTLLHDADLSVAGEAAVSIARITPDLNFEMARFPSLIDVLITASTDDWLDRNAVRALSWTGDPRVAKPLIDVLCGEIDPDPKLYEPVRDGLIRIGPACLDAVIEALQCGNSWARERFVEVLAEIGDSRALEPLLHVLQNDETSWVRSSAADVLGTLGDPRAVQPLILALQDEECRWAAVEALGQLKDKAAIGPLKQMLTDPSPDVRNAAQKSLAQLETDQPES